LGLQRDRHEFDAKHFGYQTGLRGKRAAWLEGKDRIQRLSRCVGLARSSI
jgi:hypothetical protein